jgi:hypothetical protein
VDFEQSPTLERLLTHILTLFPILLSDRLEHGPEQEKFAGMIPFGGAIRVTKKIARSPMQIRCKVAGIQLVWGIVINGIF